MIVLLFYNVQLTFNNYCLLRVLRARLGSEDNQHALSVRQSKHRHQPAISVLEYCHIQVVLVAKGGIRVDHFEGVVDDVTESRRVVRARPH